MAAVAARPPEHPAPTPAAATSTGSSSSEQRGAPTVTMARDTTTTTTTSTTADATTPSQQPQQRATLSAAGVTGTLRPSTSGQLIQPYAMPTVFPTRIASLVTALATSARLSLRVTAFFIEAILETSEYSTRMSLGYTRRILITAISSARRVYLASNAIMDVELLQAIGFVNKSGTTDAFLNVLDRWTNLGIYVIHHTFTLAELFAMSGFYLTSNTVSGANFAANESVTLFDSLFGSNESSRALSSIITLVRKELLEDERFQAADRGKVASLTALTKALTAFACLQNATWSRSSQRLKMRVLYDCTVTISNEDSFSANQEQLSPELPQLTAAGTGTISRRNVPAIAVADTDLDGDVTMTPASVANSPARPSRTVSSRSLHSQLNVASSPDLALIWHLEDLVGESGDESLDAAEATPDGCRQRLLKRVRGDMYEITDELSESTIVTQTLERVGSMTPLRERTRSVTQPQPDVLIEAMEPDDSVPSSGVTSPVSSAKPLPPPPPTTATSVSEADDETDWIEVDQLLDDDDEASVVPSAPNGRVAAVAAEPPNTERIQLVLRTMTNKLLQRKRTVRRVQNAGLGISMSRMSDRMSASPSPPPERVRSRSNTPVLTGGQQHLERPDVRNMDWGTVRQRTPPPAPPSKTSSSGSSNPSPTKSAKGKDKERREKQEPLERGRPRRESAASVVGSTIRSAFRSKPPREVFPGGVAAQSSTSSSMSASATSAGSSSSALATASQPPPVPPKLSPQRPQRQSQSNPYVPLRTVKESIRTRSNRVHAQSSQIFSPRAEAAADLFPHEGLIKNIYRFMRYSSAAYGQNFLRILGLGNAEFNFPSTGRHHANSWAFAQHTNIPIDSLLLSSYTDSSPTFALAADKPPALVHYVAVQHELKAIVLTCRGTLGLSDVLVDLTCDYRHVKVEGGDPRADYFVHSGMYESAVQLTEKCSRVHQTLVEALTQYPDYGLVLCGHSLGGGVAALLALQCSVKSSVFLQQNAAREKPVAHPGISTPFVTSFSSGLPPGRPIHCYAYGVPAVASSDLAHHAEGLITSVVQNSDVVPTLSLGVLRDLKNLAVTLFEEAGVAEEIVGRVIGLNRRKFAFQDGQEPSPGAGGPSDGQVLSDWMMSLVKTMRADMDNDKLYPPGTVYIMEYFDVYQTANLQLDAERGGVASSTRHAQRVILRQCESVEERFREPLFSKTMLNDHLPSHYERSTHLLYEGLGQGLL